MDFLDRISLSVFISYLPPREENRHLRCGETNLILQVVGR
jgi:hypothetical protein